MAGEASCGQRNAGRTTGRFGFSERKAALGLASASARDAWRGRDRSAA